MSTSSKGSPVGLDSALSSASSALLCDALFVADALACEAALTALSRALASKLAQLDNDEVVQVTSSRKEDKAALDNYRLIVRQVSDAQ